MSEFTWEVVQTADPSSGKTVIVSHHCALCGSRLIRNRVKPYQNSLTLILLSTSDVVSGVTVCTAFIPVFNADESGRDGRGLGRCTSSMASRSLR